MTALSFEVLGAQAEPYAAVPTLSLRLRVVEAEGRPVHAVALRAQIMIEPQRRTYSPGEEDRLLELFGETPRWGDTLRPFLWTHAGMMVPGFTGSIDVDLPVPVTYDFEVAAAKYLHALDGGEMPILLLFSGTIFSPGATGFSAEPIAWHEEARFRLPVLVWRNVMDLYFPGGGWLRLQRETLDALQRFKARRALPSWDLVIEQLLRASAERCERGPSGPAPKAPRAGLAASGAERRAKLSRDARTEAGEEGR